MKPLENALLQVHKITRQQNAPITDVVKRVNQQRALINQQIKTQLNSATKSITPITKQVSELKDAITSSITSQKLPEKFLPTTAPIETMDKSSKEGLKEQRRTMIIPVALEKPLSELTRTAVEIQNATKSVPVKKEIQKTITEPMPEKPEHIPKEPVSGTIVPVIIKEITPVRLKDLNLRRPESAPTESSEMEIPGVPTQSMDEVFEPDVDIPISESQKPMGPEIAQMGPVSTPIKEEQDAEENDSIGFSVEKMVEPEISKPETLKPLEPKREKTVLGPIISALGLLAGSTAATEVAEGVKVPRETVTIPIKPDTFGQVKKKEKTSVFKIEKTELREESKLIEVEELKNEISAKTQIQDDIIKTITSESESLEIASKNEIIDKIEYPEQPEKLIEPESQKTIEEPGRSVIPVRYEQVESVEPVVDITPKERQKLSTWVPITKAIGAIASVATLASVYNLENDVKRYTPHAEIEPEIEVYKKSITKVESILIRKGEILGTIKKTERPVEHRVPEIKTEKEEDIYSGLESIPARKEYYDDESQQYPKATPKEHSLPETSIISQAPAVIPASSALSMLSIFAKRSTADETLVKQPEKRKERDLTLLEGLQPIPIISKGVPSAAAKMPIPTNIAVKSLTRAAIDSKKSLFIDKVQTTATSETFEPALLGKSVQPKLQEAQKIAFLRKETGKPGILPEFTEKTIIPKFERGMVTSPSSVSAMNLLNKLATTTVLARAEAITKAFSKPVTAKDQTYDSIDKLISPRSPGELSIVKKGSTAMQPSKLTIIKPTPMTTPQSKIPVTKPAAILPIRPRVGQRSVPTKVEIVPKEKGAEPRSELIRKRVFELPVQLRKEFPLHVRPQVEEPTKGAKALGILDQVARSTVSGRVHTVSLTRPTEITSRIFHQPENLKFSRPETEVKKAIQSIVPQTPRVSTPGELKTVKNISEAFSLIQGKHERRLLQRVGVIERGKRWVETDTGVSVEQFEPGFGEELVRESGITGRPSGMAVAKGFSTSGVSPKPGVAEKDLETYPVKGLRSKDFDWLPTGAPKKRDERGEQITILEEQVRILRERIAEMAPEDREPANRKLQEFVHDPNLQAQLKKLFYESWLENMDKELKRYGG